MRNCGVVMSLQRPSRAPWLHSRAPEIVEVIELVPNLADSGIEENNSSKVRRENSVAGRQEVVGRGWLAVETVAVSTDSVSTTTAGLQYTEEKLNSEIENAIAELKRSNRELIGFTQAEELLEGSKVMDWLVANSQIEYGTVINAPRSSLTLKQAKYSGFQGGSDSIQRLNRIGTAVGPGFDVWRRLGLTSVCRKWEGAATIKTIGNVGRSLSARVVGFQHHMMNVVAKGASAPVDLMVFIYGGALATKSWRGARESRGEC
ncbi:hypothetical protein R1sor_013069 [Riccia sorocarpa]|uniref:Uncharacterized protein n=1 Tax=Riccia sorocarpa TaxID=122646 RepID=A0ABD3H5G4_9MARC